MLSDKYRVITLDFLGGGQSDRLSEWPADLWYHWGNRLLLYVHLWDLGRSMSLAVVVEQ